MRTFLKVMLVTSLLLVLGGTYAHSTQPDAPGAAPTPQQWGSMLLIRVTRNSIEIATDPQQKQAFHDQNSEGGPAGGLLIICQKFQLGNEGSYVRLRCTDATFITARGLQGQAAQLDYDGRAESLRLSAVNAAQPVRLQYEGDEESVLEQLSSRQIKIKLTPRSTSRR